MNRIKVVNEPAELVTVFRAVDTSVKRAVFKEVTTGWKTIDEIEEKFGKEGKKALQLFEKMNLVETRWESTGSQPKKAYHSYYTSFHINTSCPIYEISDVLAVAVMLKKEFLEYEEKIHELIGEEGKFAGDVAEDLGISPTMLKSLVKRSNILDYKGHRVERIER